MDYGPPQALLPTTHIPYGYWILILLKYKTLESIYLLAKVCLENYHAERTR